jgi:hypothetical protein
MTGKRKRGIAWRLAEAVERRREELGLTWLELRDEYGINQSVVHRWRTNAKPPYLAARGRGNQLIDLLGVPLDEVRALAGVSEEEPPHHFTPEEIEALIDEADAEGWELIKSRVLRRIAQEATDR